LTWPEGSPYFLSLLRKEKRGERRVNPNVKERGRNGVRRGDEVVSYFKTRKEGGKKKIYLLGRRLSTDAFLLRGREGTSLFAHGRKKRREKRGALNAEGGERRTSECSR